MKDAKLSDTALFKFELYFEIVFHTTPGGHDFF